MKYAHEATPNEDRWICNPTVLINLQRSEKETPKKILRRLENIADLEYLILHFNNWHSRVDIEYHKSNGIYAEVSNLQQRWHL